MDLLSGKGCELAWGHVGSSVLEEYPLVQVVKVEFLLVEVIETLVVALKEFRAQEVVLVLGHADYVVFFKECEVGLEPLSHTLVTLNILDQKQLQNLFIDSAINLLPTATLCQPLLHKHPSLEPFPAVNKHKTQRMCQHARVVNKFQ